jgi:hypothetical protein
MFLADTTHVCSENDTDAFLVQLIVPAALYVIKFLPGLQVLAPATEL